MTSQPLHTHCAGITAPYNPMNEEEKAEVLVQMQQGLPPNWIAQFSTKFRSRIFYFNQVTGETTWNHPAQVYSERKESITGNKKLDNCVSATTSKKKKKKKKKTRDCQQAKVDINQSKPSDHCQTVTVINRKSLNVDEKSDQKVTKQIRKTSGISKNVSIQTEGPLSRPKTDQTTSSNPSIRSAKSKGTGPIKENTHKKNRHNPYNIHLKVQSIPNQSQSKIFHKGINALPNSKSDVEMDDISLQQAIPELKNSQTSFVIFVIVDTNILMTSEGLKSIEELADWQPSSSSNFRRVVVVIPWVVLQELDHLKTRSGIAPKARNAVAYLNRHFYAKKPGIRGQTIIEAATVIEGLNVEVNDDRILQCLFFFEQLHTNHKILLFSKDNNLCNKAMINHFRSFTNYVSLMKAVMSLCQSCGTCDIQDSTVKQKNVEATANHRSHKINSKKQTTTETSKNSDLDELYISLKDLCKTAFAYILEAEMKKAFGENMWEEIVYRKPPWQLHDVLHCIKKHWIAVFNMLGLDRLLLVHVDILLANLNQVHQRRKVQLEGNIVKEFLNSSVQLLTGIGKNYVKSNPIKDAFITLKKHYNDFKTVQNQAKPSSAINKNPLNEGHDDNVVASTPAVYQDASTYEIEMYNVDMAQATSPEHCQIFWQALDQIWASVVVHCVAIFKSVNFLNSPAFEHAPVELQQQLAASFDGVPTPEMSIQVIPLLMQLMEGLLNALERFLSACKTQTSLPQLPDCLDLLQTLWTITQAFSMQTNLESISPSTVQHCSKASEGRSQLFVGYEKLRAVCNVLKECFAYIRQISSR
ncbi:transcriptional protein SWT1-like isoform X1 [Clavelina lepadiformis]|uniref:transcriptional protein SWT1-like isoform X1 n=2 Tax=Clavelina lepadiformis TaxID=159417 RepID=UPI0040425A06